MVAPVISAINDMDIERILEAASMAGVKEAGYVLLRLPLEVRDLFHEWVRSNFPERADKVINIIRETQGGKDYDSKWFTRGRGTGPYAWLIGRRFQAACERLGINERRYDLDVSRFTPPRPNSDQLQLFA
jgi:DNA repair photolyase